MTSIKSAIIRWLAGVYARREQRRKLIAFVELLQREQAERLAESQRSKTK